MEHGKVRVVIENITPRVDDGAFPIKRTIGEPIEVEADVFADGHDIVKAELLYCHHPCAPPPALASPPARTAKTRVQDSALNSSSRAEGPNAWLSLPMEPLANDRWRARFTTDKQGTYLYTVRAWVDHHATWQRDIEKKRAAGQDVTIDLQRGKTLEPEPDPDTVLEHHPPLAVTVDRERARFSSWYEFFPRSSDGASHGTFRDCIARLPYIAEMGFDVIYLPPIHPIGTAHRKGTNNAPAAGPSDPGSPWAIGAKEGGHKSIHPDLGTLEDFRALVSAANKQGMELALDIAFQTSPDHPYVHDHPEWFRKRPDGTIQYAENPPKKYQDIYPFDFESDAWPELWKELTSVVEYWAAQGVRIFRVDNPHTKPFALWQWLIAQIKSKYPDALFLAEAFTRPKIMYRLAKLGFTQSYNYFPWRNTRHEIETYFTELTQPPVREFFRPNLWPNTPDILTEYLQFGGRSAFMARAALAATLGASWGIYGPAFELQEHDPREPGSEEYRDSEKYQLRQWHLNRGGTLKDFIARLNRIRRENPALQTDRHLRFHPTDNENLICYSKTTEDRTNAVLAVVNLDPHHTQSGWIELDLNTLGIDPQTNFQVHDLLSNARFLWQGPRNYISLDPQHSPAHVFRLRKRTRTERDFDYFL